MKKQGQRKLKELIEGYFAYCAGEPRLDADGNPLLDKSGAEIRTNVRPPTVSGLALALGFDSRRELTRFCGNAAENALIENALLRIANYNEEKLFDKDCARSAIFNLSNGCGEDEMENAAELRIPAELLCAGFIDLYRDIRAGKHAEYVLKGGRGSTKSSFAALVTVERLFSHPDEHALAMRQVGATLKDSVYSQLCWAAAALGVEDEFERKQSPLELIRKATGQRIYFRGADDPSKLKSLAPPFGHIGTLWLEELDQFGSEAAVRSLEQSVLRGGDGIAIKTFNPPRSPAAWVNRSMAAPKAGRLVHHSTYLDVPPEWLGGRFIDEAEHLKTADPKSYAHEYLGECNGDGGPVFENLTLREITDDEISRFDRTLCGIDWGWYPDPFRFCRVSYVAAERRLFIYDEISGNKLSNAKIAKLLREKGVGYGDRITADSGGEGPKSIADLKTAGFLIRGAAKGPGSVEYSMKWLCALSEIVIDPTRCPCAAKEFLEYEYEKGRGGEVIGGYPDRDNHSIDAARYATEEIWRKRGV